LRRYNEDSLWHNGDTYAAAIVMLQTLSSEADVCRTLIARPGRGVIENKPGQTLNR
jgi:hypothetical protein